jgi:hypothetical protein
MFRNYVTSSIFVICVLAMLVISPCALAASPSACQTIDDAYKKQMTSPVHAKITRTSTGAMSGRYAMIYGPGGTTYSYVRDEAANGEAAAVYRQLHKDRSQTFDTLIWISKSFGLPLRQEKTPILVRAKRATNLSRSKYSK